VTSGDVVLTLIFGIGTLIALMVVFRPLLFASIDPEVAEARGVPVKFLSIFFMLLLAITVAESIQVVGVLLVFALLIAPAASAQHITRNPISSILLSIVFGLIFTWGGLLLAFTTRFPVSFYIATFAALTYFIVVNSCHFLTPHRSSPAKHAHGENGK